MKIGDYVRFNNCSWTEIGQIVDEVEDSHLKVVKCNDGCYDLDNFIKCEEKPINLIEVGDYVNGMLVTELSKLDSGDIYITYNERYKYLYMKDWNYESKFEKFKIKSIVTKEQFESMEYRIGE